MNIEQVVTDFVTKQAKKTDKKVKNLNAPEFLKKRRKKTRINYLKSFALKITTDKNGGFVYQYEDTHLYDTATAVFQDFAKQKGLQKPKQAGFLIARKKRKEGLTDVKNVFVKDRRRLFREIEKFIDKIAIQELLKEFENEAK